MAGGPKFIRFGRLDVDEAAVQRFIRTGGEVADLLDGVASETKAYSVAYISKGHIRSGRLLRGLWWNRTKAEGPLQGKASAGSSARHTPYFHDGTPAIIYGNPHMVVPKRRTAHTNPAFSGAGAQLLARNSGRKGGKGVTRKDTVRGQRAKPFLKEGLAVSLANHGL